MDFDNGPNYDYHFIKKELAEKFEGTFSWKYGKVQNGRDNRKIGYVQN